MTIPQFKCIYRQICGFKVACVAMLTMFLGACSSLSSAQLVRSEVNTSSDIDSQQVVSTPAFSHSENQAKKYELLGLRLGRQGKLGPAESNLRQALDQDPSLMDARDGLGIIYMQQDNFFLAETMFTQVLQQNKNRVSTLNALAALYDLQERYTDASTLYVRALAKEPGSARTLNNHGYSLYLQGRYEEGRSMLKQAIAIDDGYRRARSNLALLESKLDNQSDARENLVALGSTQAAMNNLGYLNLLNDRYEAARSNLNSAVSSSQLEYYPKASRNLKILTDPHSNQQYQADKLLISAVANINNHDGNRVDNSGNSLLISSTQVLENEKSGISDTEELMISDSGSGSDNITDVDIESEKPLDSGSGDGAGAGDLSPTLVDLDKPIADVTVAQIKSIQTKLSDFGLYSAKIDGSVGELTIGAIRRYKLARGIPVDDSITKRMLDKLGIDI